MKLDQEHGMRIEFASPFPGSENPVNRFSFLLLLVTVAFAQNPQQTIFIASNNKAANEIRKQLSKDSQKGKSCLAPTNDPSKADLRMDVSQGVPGSGLTELPSVSVSVTNKAGVVLFTGDTELAWERVYRSLQKKLCKQIVSPRRPGTAKFNWILRKPERDQ
jgi:hypothetical protein